jgi:hypothetical protein
MSFTESDLRKGMMTKKKEEKYKTQQIRGE